uniref:Tubulin-specific chaperone D n=1 Tax=Heterorhabditis bacteriophora TaxID=37862 RepID=A0A1I7XPP2_HETBA
MDGNGHSNGEVYNDEGEYSIHELVEWSLDCILHALSDDETTVRWSAAKGAGRITARLPRDLANQVVNSILSDNFHRLAGHCSWHGGCLALAELSRRGFLLPENLPKAFPIIREALFYEEPMGRHALGSNVRDAACYVLWAFARAYEPNELKEYINSVATSLVIIFFYIFIFNLKNYFSFSADYFAVGNRLHCYTKVCVDVVKYAKYADAMVDHLIEKKTTHWDEVIRIQASLALGRIATIHTEYVSSKLKLLLDGCRSNNPVHRHGNLLALSQCLRGILSSGYKCDEYIICSVVGLPGELRAESQRLKVAGGELTRKALSSFMGTLAEIPISLNDEEVLIILLFFMYLLVSKFIIKSNMMVIDTNIVLEVNTWLERLNSFACDDTEAVRKGAISAAAIFIPAYLSSQTIEKFNHVMDHYIKGITSPMKENERIGVCGLVSCFPAKIMNERIFRALCNVVLRKCENDMKWAMGRRAAVQALGSVLKVCLSNEWAELCFEALFKGLEDYTTNSRGDIGRQASYNDYHFCL